MPFLLVDIYAYNSEETRSIKLALLMLNKYVK